MTKSLLKDSLVRLMMVRDVDKITIKDICEGADLNRSTFYLHYQDQYALLSEVEDEALGNAVNYIEMVDTEPGSLVYVQSFLEYIRENRRLFLILLSEGRSFQTRVTEYVVLHLQGVLSFTFPKERQKYIYAFLIQGCVSVIRQWLADDCDISCENMSKLLFDLSAGSVGNKQRFH